MLTLPYAILMTEEWKRDQGAGVGLGPGPPGLQAGPPLSEGAAGRDEHDFLFPLLLLPKALDCVGTNLFS